MFAFESLHWSTSQTNTHIYALSPNPYRPYFALFTKKQGREGISLAQGHAAEEGEGWALTMGSLTSSLALDILLGASSLLRAEGMNGAVRG